MEQPVVMSTTHLPSFKPDANFSNLNKDVNFSNYESPFPNLPDDIGMNIMARIPRCYHANAKFVSKSWRNALQSNRILRLRERNGFSEEWMFVVGVKEIQSKWASQRYLPQLVAFDPKHLRTFKLSNVPCLFSSESKNKLRLYSLGNGILILMHGSDGLWRYDFMTDTWQKGASLSGRLAPFACASTKGKLYVAGGRDPDTLEALNTAEVYNPVTDTWTSIAPMDSAKCDCVSNVVCGRFHVSGFATRSNGKAHGNMLTSVYDESTDTWMGVEDLCLSVKNNVKYQSLQKMIVKINCRGFDVLDVTSNVVSHVKIPLPEKVISRQNFSFVPIGNKVYLFGGMGLNFDGCWAPVDHVLIFDPWLPKTEAWKTLTSVKPRHSLGQVWCSVTSII